MSSTSLSSPTLLSSPQPTRWDQHSLLVSPFPLGWWSGVRLSARFNGMTLELRRSLARCAPKRARDFFLPPPMQFCSPGNGPADQKPAGSAAVQSSRPRLSV